MNLKVNQINHRLSKGNNFIITLCENWLDSNDFLMYLTHKDGKPIVAEMFTRTGSL